MAAGPKMVLYTSAAAAAHTKRPSHATPTGSSIIGGLESFITSILQ